MQIIEYILSALLLGAGIAASITDLKKGVIYNKYILPFGIAALALDGLYYGIFARGLFLDFLENLIVMVVLLLLMYHLHAFAGGDIKLGLVFTLLYPAGWYLVYQDIPATLFWAAGLAVIYGYLYLLISSVVRLIRGETHLTRKYGRSFLLNFLRLYVRSFFYVMGVPLIIATLHWRVPGWLVWLISMVVVWLSRKFRFLQKKAVIAAMIGLDCFLAFFLQTVPFSLYPETYIFAGLLILCQMLIRTGIYEEIPTQNVESGMILSAASTIPMQNSRVRGLPGISKEDLSSRLTQTEAESVKRWGKTKNGQPSVTIVRKVPFAGFLLMGFVTYWVIGRIL